LFVGNRVAPLCSAHLKSTMFLSRHVEDTAHRQNAYP
jgi:hypothetical protein